MSVFILLIVSGIAAFGVLWLVHYVPLKKKVVGTYWSPRLFVCKLLIPFDISVTLLLIVGSILGIGTAIGGIQTLVFNSFVAVGISLGIWILQKWVQPRWKREYELQVEKEMKEK